MIKTIIIEDEKNARIALRQMILEDCPEIEIIGEAGQVNEAISLIEAQQPELVFMDIQLGNRNSFEILKAVDFSKFHLIFTTAYEHYAVRAFRFSAIDYLLKPINREYLRSAVDKLIEISEPTDEHSDKVAVLLENLKQENHMPRKIILSTQEMMRIIELSDIIRCEADVNYTRFYIKESDQLLISRTLKDFEEELADCHFMRVHKSHLINMQFVTGYDKREGGAVVLADGSRVPLSPRKRDLFMQRLKKLMV